MVSSEHKSTWLHFLRSITDSDYPFDRTHLIPCFFFVFLLMKTVESDSLGGTDKLVIGLFLLGAFLCHMFSTAFHAFSCHSEKVGKFFQK